MRSKSDGVSSYLLRSCRPSRYVCQGYVVYCISVPGLIRPGGGDGPPNGSGLDLKAYGWLPLAIYEGTSQETVLG